MNAHDLAWLAGLLEGEGSFMKGPPSKPGKPIIAVNMTDKDVVQRVAKLFGGQAVQTRRPKKVNHKTSYFVSVRGDGAAALMLKLAPHMGSRRKAQITAALADWQPSRALSDAVQKALVARAVAGESMTSLAKEYGVSYSYVKKHKYASSAYKNASVTQRIE